MTYLLRLIPRHKVHNLFTAFGKHRFIIQNGPVRWLYVIWRIGDYDLSPVLPVLLNPGYYSAAEKAAQPTRIQDHSAALGLKKDIPIESRTELARIEA